MKIITLFSLLFAIFSEGYAQNEGTSVYKNLKTKKFYYAHLSKNKIDGKSTYKVNGKEVSKFKYNKYDSKWKNMENCCPCILEAYDVNENLINQTVSCTDCGVGWFKEYYMNGNIKLMGAYKGNTTGNWSNIYERGFCNVPDGKWTYFNEDGDTLYSEFWNKGLFVKQAPEQSNVELWDVELRYKEQEAEKVLIPIDDVGKLEFIPKYKNSNTNSKITIKFEVSATGHKINNKELTLESFKKIDVSEMLYEVGIPKDKITAYMLFLYSDGQHIKSFSLEIIN